jgi:uncharacterized protein (TIGR00299 family) protein
MIEGSSLKKSVITRAVDIFTRIAEAEAGVHGMEPSEVAFHEVGALDSIIDIVGAAICLDVLGPEGITASPVELGGGSVACAHGILPVPAPATLALCRGFPVTTGNFDKEMTTPTGAAILASCVDEFVTRGSFVELQTAYGIGTRKLARPNVLRVSWREEGAFSLSGEAWNRETLFQLESSLDDMTGEALAFLMERLFEAGALDVNFIPCTMKKSRPAVIVTALCRPDVLGRMRETLVRHSTAIGFREKEVLRLSLPRKEEAAQTSLGTVREKTVFFEGKAVRSKIEFEDRARIAGETGLSLEQAEKRITGEMRNASGN